MNLKGLSMSRPAGAVMALLMVAGCGSVDHPENLDDLAVLTVHFEDEGITPGICDDDLPVVDGIAIDAEWRSAQPLYLRLRGEEGSGGSETVVEIRAIWTDGGSKFDENDINDDLEDRVYFLVRYTDNDRNDRPDLLAYAALNEFGEWAPGPEPPLFPVNACEPALEVTENWSLVNANGQEDQVLLLFAEAENPTDMIEANRVLLPALGPKTPEDFSTMGVAKDIEAWMWRAGRTNRHPVYQQSDWGWRPGDLEEVTEIERPRPLRAVESNFLCGFMEDLYVDEMGKVTQDPGRLMFVRNFDFEGDSAVPIPKRITEPQPSGGRDGPSDDEVKNINGTISPELGLWWHSTTRFSECTTVATSRVGAPVLWSTRPLPGNLYDFMFGWALQTPDDSQRDVRARGTFDTNEDRGNSRWTIEIMRDLNTKHEGDIFIDPEKTYKMVIGLLDNSNRVGVGSREITVKFEPRPEGLPTKQTPTWGKCG